MAVALALRRGKTVVGEERRGDNSTIAQAGPHHSTLPSPRAPGSDTSIVYIAGGGCGVVHDYSVLVPKSYEGKEEDLIIAIADSCRTPPPLAPPNLATPFMLNYLMAILP